MKENIFYTYVISGCFSQDMWETRVQALGQDDPLEKEMAPHSSTFAWEMPWTEEPGGLQSMGFQESDTTQ